MQTHGFEFAGLFEDLDDAIKQAPRAFCQIWTESFQAYLKVLQIDRRLPMIRFLKVFSIFLLVALFGPLASAKICPSPWLGNKLGNDCTITEFTLEASGVVTGIPWKVSAPIRHGFLRENPAVNFKGNIVYYQGLGDSMLNHMPLFSKLTAAGYRVIAFDYMGQGGSGGKMKNTRIFQINELGKQIWKMHARDLRSFPKRIIIGWSTGGLAAYVAADSLSVDRVVLIAPGIVPNPIVGEQHPLTLSFNVITIESLTTDTYLNGEHNPHIDPIKPTSPLKAKAFALDLLDIADLAQQIPFKPTVRGFVLLSGDHDTYVDARATEQVLKMNAPGFTIKRYAGALHEIDNERFPIREEAHRDILNFLNQP